jgi:hypothetical protein
VTEAQGAAGDQAEECGLCQRVLEAHCRLHGGTEPSFCTMLARHRADPRGYTADQVLIDLRQVATRAQIEEVGTLLRREDAARAGAG